MTARAAEQAKNQHNTLTPTVHLDIYTFNKLEEELFGLYAIQIEVAVYNFWYILFFYLKPHVPFCYFNK